MPKLAVRAGIEAAKHFTQMSQEFDILVPVPLHRTKRAERSYNQAERLAHGIGAAWGVKILTGREIRRIRPTKTQTALSIDERIKNVRDAFQISTHGAAQIANKRVLIIDDVMTTGSTMASLAHAILPVHPTSISFMTLAAARLELEAF